MEIPVKRAMQFGYDNPYSWPRKPLLAANTIATSQPLAAQAGLQMLAAGGTAVDAILATAITLTLVEPVSNGIGSDAYAIVWDGKRLHGINASGRSPEAWTPEYFEDHKSMPVRGWNTVTVPGCVAAWVEMHARWGKLPFKKLFERAIEYGREGFLVSPTIAGQWDKQVAELKDQPGFAKYFLPEGRAPRPGQRFKFPQHAKVLESIAATKGKSFYKGEWAERLEAHARKNGGALKASDMAANKLDWVKPLEMDYRGYTLHEIPPNGQGIVALMALGMLEDFDLRSHAVDGADSLHLQIEAMKLAFADARAFVADIDYMTEVKPQHLLDKDYLRSRAKLIDPKRAQDFKHGTPAKGGTVYLTAADANGMMVSFIQSNYMGFGSGGVVDGISLQNRGGTFVLQQRHPNCVGPKKRPYQTIIPGFVTKAGKPADPDHHPGLLEEGRKAGDELRRDGRHDAAAGSRAGPGTHRRLWAKPASRLRRAALSRRAGAGRQHGRRPPRSRDTRRAAASRPSHRDGRRLQPVRQRPDGVEAGR